jgi:hypothetical protein
MGEVIMDSLVIFPGTVLCGFAVGLRCLLVMFCFLVCIVSR